MTNSKQPSDILLWLMHVALTLFALYCFIMAAIILWPLWAALFVGITAAYIIRRRYG